MSQHWCLVAEWHFATNVLWNKFEWRGLAQTATSLLLQMMLLSISKWRDLLFFTKDKELWDKISYNRKEILFNLKKQKTFSKKMKLILNQLKFNLENQRWSMITKGKLIRIKLYHQTSAFLKRKKDIRADSNRLDGETTIFLLLISKNWILQQQLNLLHPIKGEGLFLNRLYFN